jgi:hypothetical protein
LKSVRVLALLILAGAVAAASLAARRGEGNDEQAVRRTIQDYFDGHASGKAEVMARAFHPTAKITFVSGDTLVSRSLEQFLGGMAGKPAEDERLRRRRIASMDIVGTSAVAKLDLDYPEVRFIDYMSLLKINGDWKIIHKSFHADHKVSRKS